MYLPTSGGRDEVQCSVSVQTLGVWCYVAATEPYQPSRVQTFHPDSTWETIKHLPKPGPIPAGCQGKASSQRGVWPQPPKRDIGSQGLLYPAEAEGLVGVCAYFVLGCPGTEFTTLFSSPAQHKSGTRFHLRPRYKLGKCRGSSQSLCLTSKHLQITYLISAVWTGLKHCHIWYFLWVLELVTFIESLMYCLTIQYFKIKWKLSLNITEYKRIVSSGKKYQSHRARAAKEHSHRLTISMRSAASTDFLLPMWGWKGMLQTRQGKAPQGPVPPTTGEPQEPSADPLFHRLNPTTGQSRGTSPISSALGRVKVI